jgi:hypothetical protein
MTATRSGSAALGSVSIMTVLEYMLKNAKSHAPSFAAAAKRLES